jgi:hypothetical protein
MQRLEHQHDRKIFFAGSFLCAHVAAKIDHLSKWNAHDIPVLLTKLKQLCGLRAALG